MTKRKTYRIRDGQILDVEEYHDGNYGAPGCTRVKKSRATPEKVALMNRLNKARLCRRKMLEYFKQNDIWATWTYSEDNRPPDMEKAKKDFQKAIRKVKREYAKRGRELFWIRNIEKGTRGAWHIHLIINEIGDTASIIEGAWEHGGTWSCSIRKSKYHDNDFTALAKYITKDERTRERRKNGSRAKPRISESSYSTSRNMPIREPKVEKLKRWKDAPKCKKGYVITSIFEGTNPLTGYKYRRYTMMKAREP